MVTCAGFYQAATLIVVDLMIVKNGGGVGKLVGWLVLELLVGVMGSLAAAASLDVASTGIMIVRLLLLLDNFLIRFEPVVTFDLLVVLTRALRIYLDFLARWCHRQSCICVLQCVVRRKRLLGSYLRIRPQDMVTTVRTSHFVIKQSVAITELIQISCVTPGWLLPIATTNLALEQVFLCTDLLHLSRSWGLFSWDRAFTFLIYATGSIEGTSAIFGRGLPRCNIL